MLLFIEKEIAIKIDCVKVKIAHLQSSFRCKYDFESFFTPFRAKNLFKRGFARKMHLINIPVKVCDSCINHYNFLRYRAF